MRIVTIYERASGHYRKKKIWPGQLIGTQEYLGYTIVHGGWVHTTYILIILREINILKAFSSQLTFSFPTTEIALPFFIGAACF